MVAIRPASCVGARRRPTMSGTRDRQDSHPALPPASPRLWELTGTCPPSCQNSTSPHKEGRLPGGNATMSATHTLSASLRGRLHAVATRIRTLRLLRGVSLVLVALLLTGALCLLADHFLELPPAVRGALLGSWVALGGLLTIFAVVVPACRALDPAALAAVIEEKYPELGERLTSSVELASTPDIYHGSPTLIALLMQETEPRTNPLAFLGTISPRRPLRMAGLAALVLIAAAVPAVVWPDSVSALAGRFLAPWRVPPVEVPYAVAVDTGDAFVKRGNAFTISAKLVASRANAVLPDGCTLVVTDSETGRSQRYPMIS